ncbi:MAG: membrane integrity-associated transporter subunit PqiC [Rhodothermia bacterium]
MTNHLKVIASVAVMAATVSGCVNLKPPPDPTRYYLLNGASDPDSLVHEASASGRIVRLAPVELEPYLDNRYMVLRLQEFEVQFSDIHRWGEELADNIRSALARDLLATGAVSKIATKASEDADYVIKLHVHRFEGAPPDIAHLSATWTLLDSSGNVLYTTAYDERNSGWVFEDYAHLAEKLDESLDTLAKAMVDKLPG